MNDVENGTTKETSTGCEKRIPVSQREGLESVRSDGSVFRLEPLGIGISHSSGKNSSRASAFDGNSSLGKILQRLELLEKAHIDCVRSLKLRLEAHLEELEQKEKLFQQSIAELRQEIYTLTIEAEKSEDNENENSSESS
ncbi:MAG TPA: hypothetical protein VK184_24140 [Nostocaceae cyanobacterium]|nr:hypothetical protein [Nostocaceae cyanobacterium]